MDIIILLQLNSTQLKVALDLDRYIFLNDLNITLGNKVDQSSLPPSLVSQFLDWTNTNGMSCNPSKCKELTIKKIKRGNRDLYSPIGMIPSCKEVEILGVTFQCDSKFSVHVKNKLIKANKSLHILRTLCKEGYNQSGIDLLFNTIVLPNINYALSVYATSEPNLTPVQCFLDRCFKRKYMSKPVSVYDFLERQDCKIFKKFLMPKDIHFYLLCLVLNPPATINLRKETCFKPKINTMRFKNSFINRLVFKYELAM